MEIIVEAFKLIVMAVAIGLFATIIATFAMAIRTAWRGYDK